MCVCWGGCVCEFTTTTSHSPVDITTIIIIYSLAVSTVCSLLYCTSVVCLFSLFVVRFVVLLFSLLQWSPHNEMLCSFSLSKSVPATHWLTSFGCIFFFSVIGLLCVSWDNEWPHHQLGIYCSPSLLMIPFLLLPPVEEKRILFLFSSPSPSSTPFA